MVLNDKQLYSVHVRFKDTVEGDGPCKSYTLQVLSSSVETAFAVGLNECKRIVNVKNSNLSIISVEIAIANEIIYVDGDL